MQTKDLFNKIDKDTLEIKVPSFREQLELQEVPDYIRKNSQKILARAESRFGSKTDLPPGVYQFNIKEPTAHEIQWTASPHFNNRPTGRIDMIVLHYTVTSSLKNTVAWFENPIAKVSAHYVIGKDGAIVQMVQDEHRAWHAGISNWRGESGCNDFSLGIEIVNEGEKKAIPYTPSQYEAVIYLCKMLIDRYHIQDARILGHSDISPYRKIDPGMYFEWQLLHRNGIGIFPENGTQAGQVPYGGYHLQAGDNDRFGTYGGQLLEPARHVRELQTNLRQIGYYISIDGDYGPKTRAVVEAFQRHYLPHQITGVVNPETANKINYFLAA